MDERLTDIAENESISQLTAAFIAALQEKKRIFCLCTDSANEFNAKFYNCSDCALTYGSTPLKPDFILVSDFHQKKILLFLIFWNHNSKILIHI